MNALIEKGVAGGVIEAISSKSYAHRMLICSALSDKPSKLKCNILSQDMCATMQCLNALGADITYKNGFFNVLPISKKADVQNSSCDKKIANMTCKECGSTLRFLLPVTAALGIDAVFTGEGRLPERPISHILDLLIKNGVKVENRLLPVKVSGKLQSGTMHIDGSVSSQYISGLLMALPLVEGDSTVIVEGEQLSKPYIDITLSVLRKYGITIEVNGNTYFIKGGQRYSAPSAERVEGDWSNAAFWVVLGAVNGKTLKLTDISSDSLQGDRAILKVAELIGADITEDSTGISIKRGTLRGIEFDARNVPDIVPVISIMCHCAEGKSVIKNVARLRDKESDRLQGIINIINKIGGCAYSDGDNLFIDGTNYKVTGVIDERKNGDSGEIALDGLKDHRMVMTGILAAALYGNITVTDVEYIDKSYPTFFDDYKAVGGKFNLK